MTMKTKKELIKKKEINYKGFKKKQEPTVSWNGQTMCADCWNMCLKREMIYIKEKNYSTSIFSNGRKLVCPRCAHKYKDEEKIRQLR